MFPYRHASGLLLRHRAAWLRRVRNVNACIIYAWKDKPGDVGAMELYRYPEPAHAPRNEYMPPSADAMQEPAMRLPVVHARVDGVGGVGGMDAEDKAGASFARPGRHIRDDGTQYLPPPMSMDVGRPAQVPQHVEPDYEAGTRADAYDESLHHARERQEELARLRSAVGALERTITQLSQRLDTQADARPDQRVMLPESPMRSISTDTSASVLRTIRTALCVVGGCMLALLLVVAVCMCVSCARPSPRAAALSRP